MTWYHMSKGHLHTCELIIGEIHPLNVTPAIDTNVGIAVRKAPIEKVLTQVKRLQTP